jgi:hypothetical protein
MLMTSGSHDIDVCKPLSAARQLSRAKIGDEIERHRPDGEVVCEENGLI